MQKYRLSDQAGFKFNFERWTKKSSKEKNLPLLIIYLTLQINLSDNANEFKNDIYVCKDMH